MDVTEITQQFGPLIQSEDSDQGSQVVTQDVSSQNTEASSQENGIPQDPQSTEQNTGEQQEQPRFKVKVQGEELEVTLDELRNGYMRDADYRRKTQEIAAIRKAVEEFEQLSGWKLDEALAFYRNQGASETPGSTDATESVDPKVQELEQKLNQVSSVIQQIEAEKQLTEQIITLKGKYGESFNEQAVIEYALQHNEPDLEKAFKLMRAEQLDEQKLREQLRQEILNELKLKQGAQAAAAVTTPSNGVGVQTFPQEQPKTLKEASQRVLEYIRTNNINLFEE